MRYASDPEFKRAFDASNIRLLAAGLDNRINL